MFAAGAAIRLSYIQSTFSEPQLFRSAEDKSVIGLFALFQNKSVLKSQRSTVASNAVTLLSPTVIPPSLIRRFASLFDGASPDTVSIDVTAMLPFSKSASVSVVVGMSSLLPAPAKTALAASSALFASSSP